MTPSRNSRADIDMRRILPDLALKMETLVLVDEAVGLGIKVYPNIGKKNAKLGFPLSEKHTLRFTPTDRGANGTQEWLSFYQKCNDEHSHPEYSIRVFVEIIDELNLNKSEAFTIDGLTIEMLIRKSLIIFYELTGKKLTPIQTKNKE